MGRDIRGITRYVLLNAMVQRLSTAAGDELVMLQRQRNLLYLALTRAMDNVQVLALEPFSCPMIGEPVRSFA